MILWQRVRPVWRGVTPAGRAAAFLASVTCLAAALTGMVELAVVAVVTTAALLVSVVFVLVPQRVKGWVSVRPGHTHAGSGVRGRLVVENTSLVPLWQPLMSVPRGDRDTPDLVRLGVVGRGQRGVKDFNIPTPHRGVVTIGPAARVRSDPFGFLHRSVTWGAATEVYVRPKVVVVPSLGAGYVRDLEGTPSEQLSRSDLSFHALREYVRGDDLRHVHWRSSARAGELLVRQYHDTRRSHVTFVLDDTPSAYRTDIEFELAVAITASLMITAATEGYELSFVCGPQRLVARPATEVLDATCSVSRSPLGSVHETVVAASVAAPTMSLLVLVTGSGTSDDALAASLSVLPGDARTLVIRSDRTAEPGEGRIRRHPTVTVARLRHLPGLMEGVLR